MNIKAIETSYNGYRFRSRLEARWAVFFDALGWDWQYEMQGYDLGDLGYYLPDFCLKSPIGPVWIEIKPDWPIGEDLKLVMDRMVKLTDMDEPGIKRFHSYLLCGTPGNHGGLFFTRDSSDRHKATPTMIFGECPFCHEACFFGMGEKRGSVYCPCILQQSARAEVKQHVLVDHSRTETMMKCYDAARSARFEHGETPKVKRGRQSK